MNPKGTVDRIKDLLRSERITCQWDSLQFATSEYVYVHKTTMEELNKLLFRVGEEIEALPDLGPELSKEKTLFAGLEREFDRVLEENRDLRAAIRRLEIAAMAKDPYVQKVKEAMTRLRAVFGGRVLKPEELKSVLAEADEVLAP